MGRTGEARDACDGIIDLGAMRVVPLGTYYDRLGTWNRLARWVGFGGGHATWTVHRALADPRVGGRPTTTRLHDRIGALLDAIPGAPRAPRVLDAGCGLGGTMFWLVRTREAQCIGVTLSAGQADTARAAVAHLGLSDRVQCVVGDYDAPPAGPFDLIVAIESLAHSADPARSVRALASVLAVGGLLVIVDDMPEPSATGSADLRRFQEGWQCPVLASAGAHREALQMAGLTLRHDVDLTPEVRPRRGWWVWVLRALNRLAAWWPSDGWRQVLASHDGGLCLERMTRQGRMRYRVLIAQRESIRVS